GGRTSFARRRRSRITGSSSCERLRHHRRGAGRAGGHLHHRRRAVEAPPVRAWLVLLAVCVVHMLAAATLDLSAEPAPLTPAQEEAGAAAASPAPAPPKALRAELRRERLRAERMLRRLRAINRRLVRAYLAGPGYVSPNAGAWECI